MTRSIAGILAIGFCVLTGCGGGSGGSGGDISAGGEITLVGRHSSSGTYDYFRERVLGKGRDYTNNISGQSGSKAIVELITNTPSAIGYSGMGYATEEVKMLEVSDDGDPVAPTVANAVTGDYPLARPLYMYTLGEPEGAVKHYIEWIMSTAGQTILINEGYVPLNEADYVTPESDAPPEGSVTINIAGSDTLVNVAGRWAEQYNKDFPNVSPQVSGGGSGTGIASLINGSIEIANASRPMKQEEIEKAEANGDGKKVQEFIVGRDALAVYVHAENPLSSISIKDLAEIYGDEGKITNWSQVEGWPSNGN